MGTLRNKIISVLDVALRVPPVFIVDSLFMNGFGGPITGSKLLQNHLYGELIKSSSSIDQHFDDPGGVSGDHDNITTGNSSYSIFDQIFPSDDTEANIVFEGGTTSTINELPTQMIWITCYIYCEFHLILLGFNSVSFFHRFDSGTDNIYVINKAIVILLSVARFLVPHILVLDCK